MMKTKKRLRYIFLILGAVASFQGLVAVDQPSGESIYPVKPEDPEALLFSKNNFNVSADGLGDDAPALQAAIDSVWKKSGGGIVFIPDGTYRLGKTVYLWRGIRLIGYGEKRPVFRLANNTPGYQEEEARYMIHFAHGPGSTFGSHIQPGTWHTPEFIDGTWSTFYSGIDNINFEIGDGNPAAIAVRYHVAQLCALENIDFHIGNGLGGVEEMGNIIEQCNFLGGEFGIKTNSSPPDWQCMVLDCSFVGQRTASMITRNARMLVIRGRFRNAPVGILLPDRDKLYVKDTWFENISKSAMVINNFVPPDLQVNLDNIKFSNVPYSIRFNGRTQGWSREEIKMDFEAPSPVYTIKSFTHGLHLKISEGNVEPVRFTTRNEEYPIESMGTFTPVDMPALPPQKTWINILDLGAKGDGITDCSDAFEKAIANHDAIYIPLGKYVISRTLTLHDQTKLIGFHPSLTQLVLLDETPGFKDPEIIKPLLVAPKNGSIGISGIGFNLGNNPGVIGIKWMTGADSYINDGLFNGSSGRSYFGKGQSHTIWVTEDGGGIFKNIWINDRRPKLAFYVSDTKTPGKIYEISVEHHKDLEVKLENVENWSFYALQLEEDRGSEKTLGIYIKDCKNILFANLICHRTTGVWEPYHTAIQMRNTSDLTIQGVDMRGGVFPFENTLFDEITGAIVPHGHFTILRVK